MLQLIYISTVTPGFDAGEVEAILARSRKNNRADRITGLLLFDGRRFMQALEGDATAVERTFQRIKSDPRHRAIVKLSERTVEAREFGEWAMAAEQITTAVAGVVDQVDRLVVGVPNATTRALFTSFARVRQAA